MRNSKIPLRTCLMLTLVILSPAVLAAQDADPGILTVSGQATIRTEPDHASLRLGVEAQRDNAAMAQAEVSRVVQALLSGLGDLGVAESDVQTASLNVRPIYSQQRHGADSTAPEVVGYRADNSVQVILGDLDKVGPAIDVAIEAGANRVLGLSFDLRDDAEAQQQALTAAVKRAALKAETMAAALGSSLGRVVEVHEGGISIQPVARYPRAEMAADMAATPVASGKVGVSATVTIRYELVD